MKIMDVLVCVVYVWGLWWMGSVATESAMGFSASRDGGCSGASAVALIGVALQDIVVWENTTATATAKRLRMRILTWTR